MFNATNTQKALVALGYNLKVDGILGPTTLSALLARASFRPLDKLPLVPALAKALAHQLEDGGISTPLRLRHFLAQAACETAGFRKMRESDGGDPHYFDRYENRAILGNTQPGDGHKFCGRGLLDTTGRYNYTVLHKLTGLDCVEHPELLEQPEHAVLAAVKYWSSQRCNPLADANDILAVTKRVNGGTNGLVDRKAYFDRLSSVRD